VENEINQNLAVPTPERLKKHWPYFVLVILVLSLLGLIFFKRTPDVEPNNNLGNVIRKTGPSEYSDAEVLFAVYDPLHRTPENFYKLDLYSGLPGTNDYLNQIVLCVNNWVEMRIRSEDIIKDRGKSGIEENENHMYYEIIAEDTEQSGDKFFYHFRLFKCSYVSDLNYQKVDDYWKPVLKDVEYGTIAFRPLVPKKIKELIEYLWLSDNHNMFGAAVVDSYYTEDQNYIYYYLYDTIHVGGDWGICDQVSLLENIYKIDKESGLIKYSGKHIKTIKGECPHGDYSAYPQE